MAFGKNPLDNQCCRRCGNLKVRYRNATVKICPVCDTGDGGVKGEVNDGSKFGDLSKEQAGFERIRNMQLSEYGAKLKEITESYFRCKQAVEASKAGFSQQTRDDFVHLFQLANIGRYYVCLQLKETAEILMDVGLIKKGDDPWNLGGKAGADD